MFSFFKKQQKKPKVVVYTATFGERDQPPQLACDFPEIPLICFSDRPSSTSNLDVRIVNPGFSDPNRNGKIFKILPHRYFPDYDYSIWFDANVIFKTFNPYDLIEKYLKNHDYAVMGHPERSCCYEEAQVCIEHHRDDPSIIKKQIDEYRLQGMPINSRLTGSGFLIRKHTPAVKNFLELWWKEIEKFSRRDQISFAYLAWKHSFTYCEIPGNYWDNDIFTYGPHNGAEQKRWQDLEMKKIEGS